MAWRPKVKGVQIPDRYLRNDIDDSMAGQLTVNKSLVLDGNNMNINLTGTNASVRLSGVGAKIYLANAVGAVGTLSIGAGNELIFQIGATTGTIINV